MARSLYKAPFVHRSLFRSCLANKEKNVSAKTHLDNANLSGAGGKQKVKNIPKYLYF